MSESISGSIGLNINRSEPSFPRFSELPGEIRNAIWELTICPRLITLTNAELKVSTQEWEVQEMERNNIPSDAWVSTLHDLYGTDPRKCSCQASFCFDPEHRNKLALRPNIPSPAILLACRESRTIAEKYYKFQFGTKDALAATHFDVARDTLYICKMPSLARACDIRDYYFPNLSPTCNLRAIENLAIKFCASDSQFQIMPNEPYVGEFLLRFSGIKRLTIVVDPFEISDSGGEIHLMEPIDIPKAAQQYLEWLCSDSEEQMPDEPMLDIAWAKINERELADLRECCREHPLAETLWSDPVIEYKMVVDDITKEYIEEIRENCRRRVQEPEWYTGLRTLAVTESWT